ncbi:MAG: GNAT family N-acetyltransferase [Gemmatimonadales bacterium]
MTAPTGIRLRLRPLLTTDRRRIEEISRLVGLFREAEIQVALEVFDAAVIPDQTDYHTLAAEVDGALMGWICWGETPCTEGTWDLYWIAVDPAAHGMGVGTALVHEMEQRLAGQARLIVIETSGRPDYRPTEAFYLARGYRAVARVPDFYAPGDDQVIYVKPLAP